MALNTTALYAQGLNDIPMLLSGAPNTGLVGIPLASGAYYVSGINLTSIQKNHLATKGSTQYLCYFNTASPPALRFLTRDLTTQAITIYNPGLPTPINDDEHRQCSIAIDNNGYIHLMYGMHGDVALIYYRSTSPLPAPPTAFTQFTTMVTGNGTPEAHITYPFFVKNPSTGVLYLTFRYSSPTNTTQQYFYTYNVGTTTWTAASGTGTGGLIIDNLTGTSTRSYLNGLPKWDTAGKLWFNWIAFFDSDGSASNEYLAAWNGSGFQDITGAVVTPPFLNDSFTPAVAIPRTVGLGVQYDFTLNNGVFYLPDSHKDGNGIYQIYVAESSTGGFVLHQLTSNTSNPRAGCGSSPSNQQCIAYPAAVGNSDGSVYVVYPDIFSTQPGQGVIAAKSKNNFVSFTNQVLLPSYTPNFDLDTDPTRMTSVVSFMKMDAADYQFGFWSGSNPPY